QRYTLSLHDALPISGSAHPYEDRILADDKVGLFAVADGVTHSSQGSGAVAAELALSLLREYFSGDLVAAISKVHQIAVRRREEEDRKSTRLNSSHDQ